MPIVNIKTGDKYDVYIGRGRNSQWGNPFKIEVHGNRKQVIIRYENYLLNELLIGNKEQDDLAALNGKQLGCFCVPNACHGDVIERYATLATSTTSEEFYDHVRWRKKMMPNVYGLFGIKEIVYDARQPEQQVLIESRKE